MTGTRAVVVSDTHLSPDAPEAQANWAAVVGYVAAAAPDVVIHLGDLSLDGGHRRSDLEYARRQLDLLSVPWYAVPGNHDIGDNPREGAPEDSAVEDDRRQRWLDVVGADYWSLSSTGWTLLAINAQLAGSGLAAEAAQWSWLAGQISACGDDERIALISHKPLTVSDAELAAAPPYRFLPEPARGYLTGLFGDRPPALVISGHVHQQRQLRLGATEHLWAPTTWAVLPDHAQPVFGAKRCGIMSIEFGTQTLPQPEFREPDGIRQLTITADIPNPYAGH